MNLANIRTYFDTAVTGVDPDLEFKDDIFGDTDIDDITAERFYKLYFGTLTTSIEGNQDYIEEMPAFLEVYGKRERDETAAFDAIYQTAIDIKNCIIDPKTVKNSTDFTEIFAETIQPETVSDTDDKTIKLILTFNVRKDFSFE